MERTQNLREIKLDKKKKINAEDPTTYLHKEA